MNRYLENQVRCLKKYAPKAWNDITVERGIQYFNIAEQLMRSHIYIIVSLSRVIPRWHREQPLSLMVKTCEEVKQMVVARPSSMKFKRVYIPKGETYRPLGVPTLPWRVYLHMWTNILHLYLGNLIPESQHGFQPGKGTLTAWKEILAKVINKQNIYEFDLKQFFPSVDIGQIHRQLMWAGVPYDICRWLYQLCSSQPILPKKLLLPEDDSVMASVFRDAIAKAASPETIQHLGLADQYQGPPKGVPQGAPTSPLLSLLVLGETIMAYADTVMYADDGLWYSDSPIIVPEPESELAGDWEHESGVKLHPGKSGFVKKDGVWLKPLKFLGLSYDGTTDTLSGATRNGSKLELPMEFRLWMAENDSPMLPKWCLPSPGERKSNRKNSDDVEHLLERLCDMHATGISWEDLAKNSLLGFAISRMYMGDINLEKIQQNFELTHIPKSWLAWVQAPQAVKSLVRRTWYLETKEQIENKILYKGLTGSQLSEDLNVFNSTSFAAASLLSILTWKNKANKQQEE